MRKDPSATELIDNEIHERAHQLVWEWMQELKLAGGDGPHDRRGIEAFAEWMLSRRPPPGNALRAVAERLTPNPAKTVGGTLAIILDGIDKVDTTALARSLAFVNARRENPNVEQLTDEQWAAGDIGSKLRLIQAAAALKAALRELSTGVLLPAD